MDKYTLQEEAFKRGYEKAKSEIIHCKDCKHHQKDDGTSGGWCNEIDSWMELVDYCSYGERVEKPTITEQAIDALKKMGEKVHGGKYD